MEWTQFTTAPDQVTGEVWAQMLRRKGIPCRVHPGDVAGFMGVQMSGVRLITGKEWLSTAEKYLEELLTSSEDNVD